MTDAEIIAAFGAPLRIVREDGCLSFIADRSVGNGGSVRVAQTIAIDSSEVQIRDALKTLTADSVVAAAAFPAHLAHLGRITHEGV